MKMNQPDNARLAAVLVGGTPMAFKPYPDGSFVVIGPNGKKFRFTSQDVEEAKQKLNTSSSSKRSSSSSRGKNPAARTNDSSGKTEPKKPR
jgi:hypothetical protein